MRALADSWAGKQDHRFPDVRLTRAELAAIEGARNQIGEARADFARAAFRDLCDVTRSHAFQIGG